MLRQKIELPYSGMIRLTISREDLALAVQVCDLTLLRPTNHHNGWYVQSVHVHYAAVTNEDGPVGDELKCDLVATGKCQIVLREDLARSFSITFCQDGIEGLWKCMEQYMERIIDPSKSYVNTVCPSRSS